MVLTEAQKKRVQGRVYRRYYRLAKKLGKDFREIEIDGKLFKNALEFELAKELELAKRGEESRLRKSREFSPERIGEGFTPRPKRKSPLDFLINPSDAPKSHSEECRCPKCMGGFSDPDLIDSPMLGESSERREAREAYTREINRQLEEACTRGICPICKSSVCRCGED